MAHHRTADHRAEIWRYSRIGELDLGAFEPRPHSPDLTGPQDHVRTGVDLVDLFPDDRARRLRRSQCQVRGDDARARPRRGRRRAADRRHPRHCRQGRATGFPAARRSMPARQRGHGRRALRLRGRRSRRSSCPCSRCAPARPPASSTSPSTSCRPRPGRSGISRRSASATRRRCSPRVALGGDYARVRTDAQARRPGRQHPPGRAVLRRRRRRCTTSARCRTTSPRTPPATCCSRARCRTTRSSVYTGLIRIGHEAKGSVAFQTNRNLTLSEGAWAESVPNLDIETNDVKCSHASTVGPIDEEQRFYLESRGVPSGGRRAAGRARLLRRGARPAAGRRRSPPNCAAQVAGQARHRAARDEPVTGRVRARRPRARHGAARFEVDGVAVAVVRIGDDVYAIGDIVQPRRRLA